MYRENEEYPQTAITRERQKVLDKRPETTRRTASRVRHKRKVLALNVLCGL